MAEYHVYTKQEFNNILNIAVGGDTIYVHGVYEESLGIGGRTYSAHLIIDGRDAELKKGFAVTNCHYVHVKNFLITGNNGTSGFEFNDSNNAMGLSNIIAENLRIYWIGRPLGGSRGIFMGGNNIHDVTIRNCHIRGAFNGTHGIYLTGAHFFPKAAAWPPIKNVTIENNLVELQPAGRHCIQLNGRFENGIIQNNFLRHSQLGGISLIGCQHYDVLNNVVYGCNKGVGIYIFDYASQWASSFNYYRTQQDIDDFRAVHHPCQHVLVEFNTFVVGPVWWYKDGYHNDTPQGDPGVLINNGVHSGFYITDPVYGYIKIPDYWGLEFDFPSDTFLIQNNIIYSPNKNYLDTEHVHEGKQTVVNHNLIYSTDLSGPPYIGGSGEGTVINPIYGVHPGFDDPEYEQWNWYGGKNKTVIPWIPNDPNCTYVGYIFDKGYNTQFNPYSIPGDQYGVGHDYSIPKYAYGFSKENHLNAIDSGIN